MFKRPSPYEARSKAEAERNNARLGTRWQERQLTHEERLALLVAHATRQAWWCGFRAGWSWADLFHPWR